MRFVLILVAVFFPSVLWAGTLITVRAGEHGEFTRITFTVPPDMSWDLSGTTVTFGPAEIAFDTSNTFNRISRKRIANVAIEGSGLRIDLGCECELKAFRAAPTLVAVDVSDKEQDSTTVVDMPTSVLKLPLSNTENLLALVLPIEAGITEAEVSDPPDGNYSASETILDPRDTNGQNRDLVSMEAAISRAATLGLVQPVRGAKGIVRHETTEPIGQDIFSQVTAHLGTETLTDTRSNGALDVSCPALQSLPDLARSASLSLSELMVSVTNELGRIDPHSSLDLGDAYLARAMGAEARIAFDLVHEGQTILRYRRAIATLIDQGESKDQPFKKANLFCESDTALWAFLFLHETEDTGGLEYASIVEQFQNWPEALQIHFVPTLSEALLKRDRSDLARIVLRSIDTNDRASDAEALSIARLELDRGNEANANAVLGGSGYGNSEYTPNVAAMRIELALKADTPLSLADLEQAKALLKEHGELPSGERLRNSLAEAFIAAGDFESAVDLWPRDALEIRLEPLFTHALHYLAPEQFAWAALSLWAENQTAFSAKTNLEISEAMQSIGFLLPDTLMATLDPIPNAHGVTSRENGETAPISVTRAQHLADSADAALGLIATTLTKYEDAF